MSSQAENSTEAESSDRHSSPQQSPLSKRTIIIAGLALLLFHMVAAASGGLLQPVEISAAETARQVTTGEASALLPRAPAVGTTLVPPLSTWLSAAGIATFGRSTIGARVLTALVTALLLFLTFVVLGRTFDRKQVFAVCLAAATAPAWVFHCGQAAPAALTTAALLLGAGCLAVLAAQPPGTSPLRLALLMGAAFGVAILSGGPYAAALSCAAVLGTLVVLPGPPQTEEKRRPNTWVVPLLLAAVGAVLLGVALSDGRLGWPGAASLALVACSGQSEEIHPAGMAWAGTAVLCIGFAVWRFRQVRQLGLHLAAPVALVIGLPWFVALFVSTDATQLCEALQEEAGRAWQPNDEMSLTVRRLGFALYPWMAFLPLSVLRFTSSPGRRHTTLAVTALVWAALSLALLLAGASPPAALLVTAAVFIAVVSAAGLSLEPEPGENVLGERAALAVGAGLLYVVFDDLSSSPDLFNALALPADASAALLGNSRPIYVGALGFAALAVIAVGGFRLPQWLPRIFHSAVAQCRRASLLFTFLVVGAFGLVTLHGGFGHLARGGSWYQVLETYGAERREGDMLYSWQSEAIGGTFYVGQDIPTLSRARDLRRVLSRSTPPRSFFATETIYFRQLSEMVHRLTGERLRPLNADQRFHVVARYSGPPLRDSGGPNRDFLVSSVPRNARRQAESVASVAAQIVGVRLSTSTVRPGDTVAVTLYFRVIRSLRGDPRVRFHIRPRRGAYRHASTHDVLDGSFPASRWTVGQTIRDRYELVVPSDIEPGRYPLSIDFIGGGSGRPEIGNLRVQ